MSYCKDGCGLSAQENGWATGHLESMWHRLEANGWRFELIPGKCRAWDPDNSQEIMEDTLEGLINTILNWY